MTAAGFGAADRVKVTGDSMSGTLSFTSGASPPIALASGTSGYVLTSDGSGNITLAPNTGASSGIALTPTAVKTGAYTAGAGEFVPCDTQTTGAWTLTLPNGPADKTVVAAKMVKQASANAVTIVRNPSGADVFNVSGTSLTLALLNQGVLLQYKASGGIWYVLADDLALSQLDARYTQLAGDLGGTTASPTVAKIQTVTIQTPTGGSSNFLNATGNWTAPSGGGGASLDTTNGDIKALGASASYSLSGGSTVTDAAYADHVHPTTGVALLAGAAFTGAVSTTGNLSASGTLAVTGNATASGTLAVSKALTSGVVPLTDASTIAVNAALGGTFRVTLGGNRTMGTPSNPTDGQMIIFEITQGLAGNYTLAWSSAYLFTASLPAPVITATAGYVDVVGAKYAATPAKWRVLAIEQAYSS